MSVESKLYSILSSTFSNELYPVVHPDPDGTETEVAQLYAIFAKVGGAAFNTLNGTGDLERPRIQISIYGINFDDVITKEAAVKVAMKIANTVSSQAIDAGNDPFETTGALPNIQVSVPSHGYESDTKRFYSHLEFYVWAVT